MKTCTALVAFVLLWAAPALGADITGHWAAKVTLGIGRSGTPDFVFKQDGTALSGTYSGALGGASLAGTVKGSDVDFRFSIYGSSVHYTGKVDATGNAIDGTVDYGGQSGGTFKATRK